MIDKIISTQTGIFKHTFAERYIEIVYSTLYQGHWNKSWEIIHLVRTQNFPEN